MGATSAGPIGTAGVEEDESISNADNHKAAEPKNNPLLTVNRGLSIKAEKGRDL